MLAMSCIYDQWALRSKCSHPTPHSSLNLQPFPLAVLLHQLPHSFLSVWQNSLLAPCGSLLSMFRFSNMKHHHGEVSRRRKAPYVSGLSTWIFDDLSATYLGTDELSMVNQQMICIWCSLMIYWGTVLMKISPGSIFFLKSRHLISHQNIVRPQIIRGMDVIFAITLMGYYTGRNGQG